MKRDSGFAYHRMSPKRLQRLVDEFEGRHNDRSADTIEQMARVVQGMDGKRPRLILFGRFNRSCILDYVGNIIEIDYGSVE